MANSASISADIAGRYARALFDLEKETGGIDALSSQVDELAATLKDNAELRDMIASPILTRHQQEAGIGAIADKMGLSPALNNTLRLMARNRRLFTLPQLATALQNLIADERGEITADVVSAQALTSEQKKRLTETLAQKSGKKVKLHTRVDEGLIGGMIVKMGSQMVDSSIRSKLASLQNSMKEVG